MTYEIKEYGSCYELVKITNNNYEVIIANIWFGSEFNEDMIPKSKAYEIIKEIKNHLELNNKRENEMVYEIVMFLKNGTDQTVTVEDYTVSENWLYLQENEKVKFWINRGYIKQFMVLQKGDDENLV